MPGHSYVYGLQPLPHPTGSDGQHGLPRAVPSSSHPEQLSQTIPGSFIHQPREHRTVPPPAFVPALSTDVQAAVNYQSMAIYSSR